MPVPIPFPVSSSPGERPQDGAGRLINCVVVKTEQGARLPFKWLRSSGLRPATTLSVSGCRGMFAVFNSLLDIRAGAVFAVTYAGGVYTSSNLGALSGTALVTIARNGKTPTPDIVCVTDNGCFNLYQASAPTPFADADLPFPNSVTGFKNYFIWTHASGRISASDVNSVSVATNSFTTASGNLLRGVALGSYFLAFGPSFFEIYRDVGATPFPLEFVDKVPRGLAGTHAIAGWEVGGPAQLLWVADDDTVVRFNGSAIPSVVSHEDVQRAIAQTTDKSVLQASVYTANGISFWVLSKPGSWSWELNLSNSTWVERQSYGRTDWRVSRTMRVFDKWLAGDLYDGSLMEIDPTYQKEGTEPLIRTMESGSVASFPSRLVAPGAWFDYSAALGNAAGADSTEINPQVSISWSRDGGYNYGDPVLRAFGQQGHSQQLVRIPNLGIAQAKGYRFRLSDSDPVQSAFMGGAIDVQQRSP